MRCKISCEKIDSFIFFRCSVVLECFPVKETFALTRKYILQKKTKAKNNKKIFNLSQTAVQKQTYKNTLTKVKVRKRWQASLKGQLFCIIHFPTCLCVQLYSKSCRRKETFHKVLDNSGLQSLMLLIITSAKTANDYILQKLNTRPFANFFGTGKKSKDS